MSEKTSRLEEIVDGIAGFSRWTHIEKIKFFAWYLYSEKGRERFAAADIRNCYDQLVIEAPASISTQLSQLLKRKPKVVLKNGQGYTLEKKVRDEYAARFGQRSATVKADKLLTELSDKVANLEERIFLDEAIKCFRAGAFRACIVMAWNLSYYHLCNYILNYHLADFNRQWPSSFAQRHKSSRISSIAKYDDFAEMKESEVIQVCRSANIISNDVNKVLKEKLDKRNTAAHPSSVSIAPHTAEEYIIDLITNVVLKLN